MPLSAGTRLGPYEIVAPLGAGGMGEVYRARDTRLAREVALKILPAEVANDPSRRQRFELEARAVAALNDPNIVAVYDVGEGYIVSELVDGDPLRGKKFGPRKILDIAIQLAGGLAAAHDVGIVHRDLKPDNILLARDGRVKILDFGLAKVIGAKKAVAAVTETLAVHTQPGMVMGTVAYMSPEQVRGHDLDHRSDMFSFGLILYELLTGNRAFAGDTSVETMTAILKDEPPDLPESVPAGLRQVVAHCLEKDPANRFQSARDLCFALTALSQGSSSTRIAVRPVQRKRLQIALAASAILAVGIAAGWAIRRPVAPQRWNGVLLGGPELSTNPRLSPDGHWLAFVAKDADDVMQLWVMKPESGNRIMLTHRRDCGYIQQFSWSPDGSRIYYDRWYDQPKGVFSVPVLGGEEQSILESGWSPEALPDGSMLIGQLNPQHELQLFRYWPDTGKSRAYPVIMSIDVPSVRAFPDGRRALVAGMRIGPEADTSLRMHVIDLESGRMRVLDADLGESLFSQVNGAVMHDGKSAVFASTHGGLTRILSIPVDGSAPAQPLFTLTAPVYSLDTGADGGIYLDQLDRPVEVIRFPAEGGHVERIASVLKTATNDFAALPDGRAVWMEFVSGKTRLMLGEAGKEPVPFVNTTEETTGPLAAVGTSEVAFLIGPQPRHTIGIASLSSGRITSRIEFAKGSITEIAASPDGNVLYCAAGGDIWAVPRQPSAHGGEPRRIRAGNFVTVEPDGQAIAVELREPPNTRLIRVPLKAGVPSGPEQEIPLAGPLKLGFGIDPGAVRNGRLVAPGSTPTCYWPPAIFDLATGKSERIPLDYTAVDFHHLAGGWQGACFCDGLSLEHVEVHTGEAVKPPGHAADSGLQEPALSRLNRSISSRTSSTPSCNWRVRRRSPGVTQIDVNA